MSNSNTVANYLFGGIGPVVGVVCFLVALRQGLWRSPRLVLPATYQTEQLKAHPLAVGAFPPDLAWPLYIFRQARTDLRVVHSSLSRLFQRVWQRPVDTFFRGRHGSLLLWWTLLIWLTVPIIFLLLQATLAAWACYVVYWLVVNACVAVNGAAADLISSVLNAAEARRRARKHTHAACMRCFHVSPWPAYRCPGCLSLHHDVRPGRLGLFFRRCECGTRFPTLASRAAWQLTAVCQRTDCQQPLPEGAGAVRDVRIPVFGDTSAGKTRFLYASLNSLLATTSTAGIAVTYPDQSSEDQVSLGLDVIRSGQDTAKTSAAAPAAVTFRLREGRASDLVHLFDAAGEQFRDAKYHDSLRFLDDSQGLVYVLDPFAVPAVQNQLAGQNSAAVRLAHAAAGDPEIAYGEVMSRLRDGGVPAASQRLAVVISKTDLLRGAGLAVPSDSDALAAWLADQGMYNLVQSARREFAEVRYFAVASQHTAASAADDPGVPLYWLLAAHGVRLPAGAVPASSPSPPVPSQRAEARS